MLLFDGDRNVHGRYASDLREEGGGKLKGHASTVKQEVTIELWYKHLAGTQGLGIIPIDASSRVRFAAIDIDEYPLDLVALNANIQRLKLPLVLCRTKSGGAHLFLFLETFSEAAPVQKKMRDFAALLGYGNSEIFPKQTLLQAERGDVGSWINMPYFLAHGTTRYALDAEGNKLDFPGFMKYAPTKIISFETLMQHSGAHNELLPGGPPCLNHLCSMGFPPGTRNNGIFNLAVYCKKVYGDNWHSQVHKMNLEFMTPPLDAKEVEGVVKSLAKKEFSYTCKQAPISSYCNMPKCRQCRHGIGQGDLGLPKFGSLTKILSDPPIWFLEIEGGGRLELTTDDLQSPREFQSKCMSMLNIMPMMPKQADWNELIHQLLQEVTEVPIPFEATPRGQLWQHLEDFLTSRVQAKTVDELLLGKPWYNNGFYYFRNRDFLEYLDRKKFRAMPIINIPTFFHDWKFPTKFWNVRGKGINCYVVDETRFTKQDSAVPVPEINNPEKVL